MSRCEKRFSKRDKIRPSENLFSAHPEIIAANFLRNALKNGLFLRPANFFRSAATDWHAQCTTCFPVSEQRSNAFSSHPPSQGQFAHPSLTSPKQALCIPPSHKPVFLCAELFPSRARGDQLSANMRSSATSDHSCVFSSTRITFTGEPAA